LAIGLKPAILPWESFGPFGDSIERFLDCDGEWGWVRIELEKLGCPVDGAAITFK